MPKRSLFLGLFLTVTIYIYYNPWIYDETLMGNFFARALIEQASKKDGSVYIGDPTNIQTRICFSPFFRMKRLNEQFPAYKVVYQQDDDSNKWYIAKYKSSKDGIVILSVDQNVLEWNDFSSARFVERNAHDLKLRADPKANIVCPSRITIKYSPGDVTPLFRPDYATAWHAK